MSKVNGSVESPILRPAVKAALSGKPRKKMPTQADPTVSVRLLPLNIVERKFKIVGDSPLCCHAWSAKAIKMILDKQMGRAMDPKEPKVPELDYAESLYWMSERPKILSDETIAQGKFGFPAIGIKGAMVTAANDAGMEKTASRRAFHVIGQMVGTEQLVPIIGAPSRDTRMVRVGMGTADVRIRGWFFPWSMVVTARINRSVMSDEQFVNLLNLSGFGVGIGEWRSEKDGAWGLYHVE